MIANRPDQEPLAIKDWELIEEWREQYFYLEVPSVLTICSEVDKEECRVLLRAVINGWIYLQLKRYRINLDDKEFVKRERALLINHTPKTPWDWQWDLQEVAGHYQRYDIRGKHNAVLMIKGNRFQFDSTLRVML